MAHVRCAALQGSAALRSDSRPIDCIPDGGRPDTGQFERARGGVGLIVLEASAVHPGADIHGTSLRAYDDRISGQYDLLAKFNLPKDLDIGTFVTKSVQTRPNIRDSFTVITFSPFLPSKG